jgi:hypothetical protein
MKVWYGYGSEHSMNLVMIGHFRDVRSAEKAKQLIDSFTKKVRGSIDKGTLQVGEPPERYADEWLDFLRKMNVYYIGTSELEQFAYDIKVTIDDKRIVVTTDESEVSAFLKLLVNEGARLEVYSAHEYPDTGYGRGSKAKAEA